MGLSRRRVLMLGGTGGLALMAGCLSTSGGSSSTDPATIGATSADSELPPPTRGDGPVGVAVFKDFSCPPCRQFTTTIEPRLIEEQIRPGRITYVHRDYVLPVDDWSRPVANAARAVQTEAGEEAFWSFVEAIYPQQSEYSLSVIESTAESVAGVGTAAREAAATNAYDERLQADAALAAALSVPGTPAVFVDGEFIDPSATQELSFYQQIARAIENAR